MYKSVAHTITKGATNTICSFSNQYGHISILLLDDKVLMNFISTTLTPKKKNMCIISTLPPKKKKPKKFKNKNC